jgi:DNA-binding transcriptional LysR family regulator
MTSYGASIPKPVFEYENDFHIHGEVVFMLVRHLSYFIDLARERHFAKAAEASHISQPTLSAAIRKLEDDLGVRLVVRDHQFKGLTSEGETLLAWSRQILSDYDSLREDIAGARRGLTGTLRLGVVPAAMPCVSLLTSRFAAAHPAAKVEIQSLTSRAIERGLGAFELDGGITYLDNEPLTNVRRVPLYLERYIFVARRDHPCARQSRISWAEAAAQRLCLLSEDMQNRRIIDKLAASIGLSIEPQVSSNSFLALCSHLCHGSWASILPHTFVHLFGPSSELVAIDLVEPVHCQAIGLVLSNRSPSSPMANAILGAVTKGDFEALLATEFAEA